MATTARERAEDRALPGLGDVLEFMRLVWALDHGLQTSSKRMRRLVGVTGPQRLVIRIVGRAPGIAAGRLAAVLHLDPSTLSVILKTLEAHRLVKRCADPADARRALFELTEKGRAVNRRRAGTVEETMRRALSRLPRRDVEAARRLLAALAADLPSGLRAPGSRVASASGPAA